MTVVTVRPGHSVSYNGATYLPGEKIDMKDDEAERLAGMSVVEIDEVVQEPPMEPAVDKPMDEMSREEKIARLKSDRVKLPRVFNNTRLDKIYRDHFGEE